MVDWPHRHLQQQIDDELLDARTVLCVLTHDPKFDVPLLGLALRLTGDLAPAYIGAMGSRRTHDHRLARLREVALGHAELARLSSPIGLDLGARVGVDGAVRLRQRHDRSPPAPGDDLGRDRHRGLLGGPGFSDLR